MKLSDLAGMGMQAGGSRRFRERPAPGGYVGDPSVGVPGGPSMDPPNGQPHWSSMRNDIYGDENGQRQRRNPGLTSWDFMRGPNQPIGQGPANDSPVPAPVQEGDQFDNNWTPLNGGAGRQAPGGDQMQQLQQILSQLGGGGQGLMGGARQGFGGGQSGGADIERLLAMLRGG